MSAPKGMVAVESGEHMGIEWCIVAAPIAAGNGIEHTKALAAQVAGASWL